MAGTRSKGGVPAAGSSRALYEAWTEHRHFKYRGCAPDADDPTRLAGNPVLPLDTHLSADGDEPETPAERQAREAAAIEVCLGCPVMAACDAYASSAVVVDGTARLAEPDGVRGGRTALERHRAFIARRHEVSAVVDDARLRTEQKLAVVAALARCWDPYEVAERAGLDLRTSNWQRSSLLRLLGLPKTASRDRLLEEAQRRGLLDGEFVRDGGKVRAWEPTPEVRPERGSASSVPAVVEAATAVVTPAPAPAPAQVSAAVSVSASRPQGDLERPRSGEEPEGPSSSRTRVPSPRRSWFTDVPGQLDFDDLFDDLASWLGTPSTSLTHTTARLEAAA